MPNSNAMPLCCVKDYTCSDAFLCTWCTWQHRGSILRRGERGIEGERGGRKKVEGKGGGREGGEGGERKRLSLP